MAHCSQLATLTHTPHFCRQAADGLAAPIYLWIDIDHRPNENALFLCEETQVTRDDMLSWRNRLDLFEMACCRDLCRSIWNY